MIEKVNHVLLDDDVCYRCVLRMRTHDSVLTLTTHMLLRIMVVDEG